MSCPSCGGVLLGFGPSCFLCENRSRALSMMSSETVMDWKLKQPVVAEQPAPPPPVSVPTRAERLERHTVGYKRKQEERIEHSIRELVNWIECSCSKCYQAHVRSEGKIDRWRHVYTTDEELRRYAAAEFRFLYLLAKDTYQREVRGWNVHMVFNEEVQRRVVAYFVEWYFEGNRRGS